MSGSKLMHEKLHKLSEVSAKLTDIAIQETEAILSTSDREEKYLRSRDAISTLGLIEQIQTTSDLLSKAGKKDSDQTH